MHQQQRRAGAHAVEGDAHVAGRTKPRSCGPPASWSMKVISIFGGRAGRHEELVQRPARHRRLGEGHALRTEVLAHLREAARAERDVRDGP